MASVNKAIIIGNLGNDPDMRYLPSGDAVANLSIATTDKYKDKNGETKESTEWHRVSFFGKTAEICGQYLKKGSQVYVEGAIRTRKWQDKEGQDRYTTEIKGDQMQMLGSPRGDSQAAAGNSQPPRPAQNTQAAPRPASAPAGGSFDDLSDDIPF